MVEQQPRAASQLWSPGDGAVLDAAAVTHAGPVRRLNEDCFLVRPPVYVVADGMGGHLAGDLASAAVVEAFSALADGRLDTAAVHGAVERAAAAVAGLDRAEDGHAPGSTVVAACWVEESGVPYWCTVSMGDSRIYVLSPDDRLTRLTHDHSVVQELIDEGSLSEQGARRHPERNVVTRALGADLHTPADFSLVPVDAGSRLLLCSDGVCTPLDDLELRAILRARLSPVDTAEQLVAAALRSGGRDNATAVVVDVLGDASGGDPAMDDTVENLAAVGGGPGGGRADGVLR